MWIVWPAHASIETRRRSRRRPGPRRLAELLEHRRPRPVLGLDLDPERVRRRRGRVVREQVPERQGADLRRVRVERDRAAAERGRRRRRGRWRSPTCRPAPPVTKAHWPEAARRCFGPRALVAAGIERVQRPAVAVSVPSGLRIQPRLSSKSSYSGPQSLTAAGLADRGPRAGRLVDEVQDRGPVAGGLRRDRLVGRVVVAPHRGLLGGVELEGVREDPVLEVQPVDLVAVGDVQVGRLLGRVAVASRPSPCPSRRRPRDPGRSCRAGCRSSCSRTATG